MDPKEPRPSGFLSAPLLQGRVKTPPFIIGIFLTVFLDLIAFGLFIPDLQLRGKELGATGFWLGLLQASFSVAQLLTAPLLGRLSDRHGRRIVLLISTLLSAVAYFNYAYATSVFGVALSRVLSGIAAANLGVAFAYVSDVTKPEERSKSLGLLGAAFGLGFTLGPPTGGFLLKISHGSPWLLGIVGAVLSSVNFLYVLLLLPESKKARVTEEEIAEGNRQAAATSSLWRTLKIAFGDPRLALVLFIFFAIGLGFTNLESTYFLLLASPKSVFHLTDDNARTAGALLLTCVGLVAAFTQGGLIGVVNKRFGEMTVLRTASLLMVPAIALVPFLPLWIPAILGICFLGTSSGLTNPNVNSLVSRLAPPEIRGAIFGVTQSLGAFARMLGPLMSNVLFDRVSPSAPYLLGSAIIFIAAMLSWRVRMPEPSESAELVEESAPTAA
jgi:MFS family permease